MNRDFNTFNNIAQIKNLCDALEITFEPELLLMDNWKAMFLLNDTAKIVRPIISRYVQAVIDERELAESEIGDSWDNSWDVPDNQ